MVKTVDRINQWCPFLCKEQSLSYHTSCFWKFSHHKEGPVTSNMNSDEWPAVPHAVCAETGQHWLTLPTICHTVQAGTDDTYLYKYHTNPSRWKRRPFLRCQTPTSHWMADHLRRYHCTLLPWKLQIMYNTIEIHYSQKCIILVKNGPL
jgi:hypothetical protein